MKKIIIGFGILILVIVIGVLGYQWVIDPVSFNVKKVDYTNGKIMNEPLKEFDCYNDYPNIKPSDNPDDYVCIDIDNYMKNRSILKVNGVSAHIIDIDEKCKDRVMYIVNGDTFVEGDNVAENFCEKDIAGGQIWIYVGDLKSQEEIIDVVYNIVNSSTVKYIYNLQWLGTKIQKKKLKIEKNNIDFFDEYKEEEPVVISE